MSAPARNKDNEAAIQLTIQANTAELNGDYQLASDLHKQATQLLNKAIATLEEKTEERKRAKLQLRTAQARQTLMQSVAQGKAQAPNPLPTSLIVQKEVTQPGITFLSFVELGLLPSLPRKEGDTAPADSPQFLTPLLDTSLPDVTYHVYLEKFTRFLNLHIYVHVKDDSKAQTLYTVTAVKAPRYQIPTCTMYRSGEAHNACAQVVISPIKLETGMSGSGTDGRALSITTLVNKTIVDSPDRVGYARRWTPGRFSYGGRRFVWKDSGKVTNLIDCLYEVRREWAKPGSKTGKKEEETFTRRLVWGETKFANEKIATLHMVGGLDQMFREYLLAKILTQAIVGMYGHK